MAIVRKVTAECSCTKLVQSGDLIVYAPSLTVDDNYMFDCFASYEDALVGKFSKPLPYLVIKFSHKEGSIGPFLVLKHVQILHWSPVWLCLYNDKYIWVKVEGSHVPGCHNIGMLTHSAVDE